MATYYCVAPVARRPGQGLLLSGSLPYSSSSIDGRCSAFFPLSCKSRHTRIFASTVAGGRPSPSPSPSPSSSSKLLPPELRPRMPAVPEPRPKPTTAVAVVENYLDNLWRDFFTKPHNWFDNRLRRRAPKYADFKNKITKEGLWITARWNPPWVRTELSLMTDFKPVPYDDPMWEANRKAEDEESREKPPPVVKAVKAGSTEAASGPTQLTTGTPQVTQRTFGATRVDVWRKGGSMHNSSSNVWGQEQR